jgi:hypothetical protein
VADLIYFRVEWLLEEADIVRLPVDGIDEANPENGRDI